MVQFAFDRPWGRHMGGGGHPILMLGVCLVVLALVGLGVLLVTRLAAVRHPAAPPLSPMAPLVPSGSAGPGLPANDAALTQVRLRYANGELSREQFLQLSADLGGYVAPVPPTSE